MSQLLCYLSNSFRLRKTYVFWVSSPWKRLHKVYTLSPLQLLAQSEVPMTRRWRWSKTLVTGPHLHRQKPITIFILNTIKLSPNTQECNMLKKCKDSKPAGRYTPCICGEYDQLRKVDSAASLMTMTGTLVMTPCTDVADSCSSTSRSLVILTTSDWLVRPSLSRPYITRSLSV